MPWDHRQMQFITDVASGRIDSARARLDQMNADDVTALARVLTDARDLVRPALVRLDLNLSLLGL